MAGRRSGSVQVRNAAELGEPVPASDVSEHTQSHARDVIASIWSSRWGVVGLTVTLIIIFYIVYGQQPTTAVLYAVASVIVFLFLGSVVGYFARKYRIFKIAVFGTFFIAAVLYIGVKLIERLQAL
jgi:hypothetical protein